MCLLYELYEHVNTACGQSLEFMITAGGTSGSSSSGGGGGGGGGSSLCYCYSRWHVCSLLHEKLKCVSLFLG